MGDVLDADGSVPLANLSPFPVKGPVPGPSSPYLVHFFEVSL